MIRSPIGLRLNPQQPLRDQLYLAARLGARGVVLDAAGELAPDRLSETGRRDLRHVLRTVELKVIAFHLPTRRPFDTLDQLEDRLERADRAFALSYEMGSPLLLARLGGIPAESDTDRRSAFLAAARELARRADHRGVRLAMETGPDPGSSVAAVLEQIASPGLAASVEPASWLSQSIDPVVGTRELGSWIAHAYATDAGSRPAAMGVPNPRGLAFPPGALDWEEYMGALEEVNYRGSLTIWPDPSGDVTSQFQAIMQRLARF